MLSVVVAANMRALLQSCPRRTSFRLPLLVLVLGLIQATYGQDMSLNPVPPVGAEPDWQFGPVKASLGKVASIEVPEGYRFTDIKGAQIYLRRLKNPVSPNLLGILVPDSGKYWVVIEFAGLGYVKDLDQSPTLDAAAVLAIVRARVDLQNNYRLRIGALPITSVTWTVEPVFDANRYALEWAVRAETRTEKMVNHTVRMLGRRGVLDATAVMRDEGSSEAISLRELAAKMSFNPGERYIDYQRGDKLSTLGLVGLIAGEDRNTTPQYLVKVAVWAGAVFVAGALAGMVVVIRRLHRSVKAVPAHPTGRDPGLASLFGNGNGAGNHPDSRRKKTFNYHKYYSDMMLQVSSGPIGLMPANGKTVARENNRQVWPRETVVNQAIVHANLELIANQTNLIEEQKRLLQEQTKLIEEKSKLIREKNEVLEKQAELFERDLL
jgi:uncharacterized membrane-anchored protein